MTTISGIENIPISNSITGGQSSVVSIVDSSMPNSKWYIVAVLYNYYMWCGGWLTSACNEGMTLLSQMSYWHEFGRITFRSFCYSALTASGPLLLSPPSLLTFAHTLVSGITCVIYASRSSLLRAVLKFTYGNLVNTYCHLSAAFLLLENIFTRSKLISHCQYQKRVVCCC